VVVIEEQVYGSMTPERALALIDHIKAQESDGQMAAAPAIGDTHVQ